MIGIVVADTNPQIRDGLATTLSADPAFAVGPVVEDLHTLVGTVRARHPDVVVVASRPRGLDLTRACSRLSHLDPRVRVVATLPAPRRTPLLTAFAAGARAVVLEDAAPPVLRAAVRSVVAGWSYVEPRLTATLVQAAIRGHRRSGEAGLTAGELRVVERLASGLSDREIASRLGIQERTVADHVRRATRKLGARDRAEVATIARRRGVL